MLSDIEVTYFRSRIEDVLRDDRSTVWQRQFLVDMGQKIERFGTRTSLSEKQLSTLKRLTRVSGNVDVGFVVTKQPKPLAWSETRPRDVLSYRRIRRGYRDIRFVVLSIIMIIGAIGFAANDGMRALDLSTVHSQATTGSSSCASSRLSVQTFSVTDGDTIRRATVRRSGWWASTLLRDLNRNVIAKQHWGIAPPSD